MTTKKLMGLLAVAAPLMVSQASAEIEGSVTAGYASMYEFRGANLGDSLAEATVAMSYEYSDITFGGSIWYASTNDDQLGDFSVDNEVDYTLTATKEFGPVTATLGYVYYSYPEASAFNTQEVFLTLGYELPYEVTATGSVYYDFDLYDAWYLAIDFGKSFEITEQVSLNLNAGVGSIESNDSVRDGMNHYYIKAALAWTPKENLTVTPYVKFTDADSDFGATTRDVNNAPDNGGENIITGVTVNVAF